MSHSQPNRQQHRHHAAPGTRRVTAWLSMAASLVLMLWAASANTQPSDSDPPRSVMPSGITVAPPLTPNAQPAPPPVPPKPSGANFKLSNYISNITTQAGVLACASRVTQVTNFLVPPPKQAGALMMTVFEDRDQQLVPLLLETESDSGPVYISASFAPNQINGCGASYETVSYWPEKCTAVAFNKQFEWFKSAGVLHKKVQVLSKGAATKIFLMPAGNGCIVIKKEVVL